jgi:hypothetical protein
MIRGVPAEFVHIMLDFQQISALFALVDNFIQFVPFIAP